MSGIGEIFNQRILGGEIPAEKFTQLNKLRYDIISKHPEFEKYLQTKSKLVRMLAVVFIEHPYEIIAMAVEIEGRKNERNVAK